MKNDTKKKRGRKPKNNIIVKENPVFENLNEDNIIKLKKQNIEISKIKPYTNESESAYLPEDKHSEICWNCCHPFHNHIHGLPIKYHKKIYYTYGDFCSIECSLRYLYENYDITQFREIYSNIVSYTNDLYDKCDVKMAPDKLNLKVFGGGLSIDEYRESFSNKKEHVISKPNIIQVRNNFSNNTTKKLEIENDLVLYRKKPLQKENCNIKNYIHIN